MTQRLKSGLIPTFSYERRAAVTGETKGSSATTKKKRGRTFLVAPYAEMEPEALLLYFQYESAVHHFSLSKGSISHAKRADQTIENIFTFNNQCYSFSENFDWKVNPSQDIEWLILLHKFYYAKDLSAAYAYSGDEKYAKKWVSLILSWIENVPDGFINSQVTGRRLQQWVLSYRYFIPNAVSANISASFLIHFLKSIHSQTIYLSEHLTPEGNHRTIELYAIFLVAVLFPELQNMAELLCFAKVEILKNMQDDLLSDGVQRELSPDYHHTVLKNYLKIREIALLNQIPLPIECDRLIKKALAFSLYAHKPDGFLPAISDGDSNSYRSLLEKAYRYYPDENLRYVFSQGKEGIAPPHRSKGFRESGYYILRSDWNAQPYKEAFYLFFDCAPLGDGSHGHYDLLNFEMAAYGHTLIVDPGRYTYSEKSDDGINWRRIFKGTAYHNTITVDGKDQMPYRKGAPLVPGPKPVLKSFETAVGFDYIAGAVISNEYPVIHERHLFFLHAEYWIVIDRLKAEGSHDYSLRFHLHPRAQHQTKIQEDTRMTCVTSPNFILAQPFMEGIRSSLERGHISPEYGVKQEAPVITFSQKTRGNALYATLLYPYRTTPPKVIVETVPVYEQAQLCSEDQVVALKMTWNEPHISYYDYFFIGSEDMRKEYTFDDIRVKGKLVLLRRDEQNHLTNIQGNQIDFLAMNGQTLLDFGEFHGKVSYQGGLLHLDTDAPTFYASLHGVEKIVLNGLITKA